MNKLISLGFWIAGLGNILGAIGSSRFFTNPHLAAADPDVMSNFGLVMIVLWGCAYLATASHWKTMRWLVAVFCVEKAVYAIHWFMWVSQLDSLGELYDRDFMAGLFFTVYGPNDLLFALFFAFAFVRATQLKRTSAS